MPAHHTKASDRAHEDISPANRDVTSKSPVGNISVVTLIRTDITGDHSQKAEKVMLDPVVLGHPLSYQVLKAYSESGYVLWTLFNNVKFWGPS